MKLNIFKHSDFVINKMPVAEHNISVRSATDIANKKLNEWIEKNGIKVFGQQGVYSDNNNCLTDTHQALLICIEELPKKECEHEMEIIYPISVMRDNETNSILDYRRPNFRCAKCKAKLKVTWEIAE